MTGSRWQRVGAAGVAALLSLNLHSVAVGQQGGPREYREVHLGMEVRLLLAGHPTRTDSAARLAFDLVDSLDLVLSDWLPASELRRLEEGVPGQWIPISCPLGEVLGLALDIAAATEGAFDPTIGPLTRMWREERRTGRSADQAARRAAMGLVGWRNITLDRERSRVRLERPGIQLDFGAIAKGWILDRAADTLAALGFGSVLLEAGGDIVVRDPPPGTGGWRVAVGDTMLVLSNAAVSSSGPTMQWIRGSDGTLQSHVIDSESGRGRSDGAAATVVGPNGAMSDAIATALTLVPPAEWPRLATAFGVTIVRAGSP
jgi:thiamine biosynthesis lipoprotein